MNNGIIFDLDGTLWDSSAQVVPAWNIVLGRHKELDCQITISDMQSFMGKTLSEITKLLLPIIPIHEGIDILKECCNEEQIYLREHGGILFPKLEETLSNLKEHYKLYIVSNCQDGYIQTFLNYHKIWDYFEDFECSGKTGMSKGENIKTIIDRNNLDKAIYVGDTQGDLNAADFALIPFIYASYGFGNIDRDSITIGSFSEIEMVVIPI